MTKHLRLAGETLRVVQGVYWYGGIAIKLHAQDGEPFLTLTTNLPETPTLPPGEFAVKVWSENEPHIADILAAGLFEDTGKRIPTGFVEAHVWRLK
jgi:hypothetical protein